MLADQILLNANIVSMDPNAPDASAFGIVGNRLWAVGSDNEVRKWAGNRTKVVDLGGKTVIPGFIESHNHMSLYAMTLLQADCYTPPSSSVEDVKARVREIANAVKPGQWLKVWRYDDTLIAEKRHVTRMDLDEASPQNPVFIHHIEKP